MKKILGVAVAAGLFSLAACNTSEREKAADNIEANAEAMADNMEDMADNMADPMSANSMENAADATRATGQNQAEDLRTNDADTNLSNGM